MALWSRLDRYLSRELRAAFFLGFSGFTLVFLLQVVFELARQTIEKRVPFRLVVGFVLAQLPEILLFTMPMGALVAVLVAVGRLAVQSELIALQASAVSRWRVFRTVAILALTGFLIASGLAHWGQPMGALHRQDLLREIVRARDVSREIDPGVFYQRLADTVLYASEAVESSEGRVFEEVMLYRETPRGDTASLILAARAQPDFDRETGRVVIRLENGEQHVWDPASSESHSVARFENYTLTFPPDPAFRVSTQTDRWSAMEFVAVELPDELRTLRVELAQTEERGRTIALERKIRKAEMELHRRLALPAAIPLLSFAAFPLAFRSRRGGRFAGLTQSLLIIILYWVLFTTGQGFAEDGRWPPWVGMWLANAVVLAWGLWSWLVPQRETRGILGRFFAWRPNRRERSERRRRGAGRASEPTSAFPGLAVPGAARIDRYVALSFVRMVVVVSIVLAALVLVVEGQRAVSRLDESMDVFPWVDLARYLALSLPEQIKLILPIAALAAAGISLSGLARAGEIVAMKAAGISPVRIAMPVVVTTILLAGAYGFAQETVLPSAAREARSTMDELRGRTSAKISSSGRRWIAGENGTLWAYLDWDPSRRAVLAPGIFEVDLERARLLRRVEASEAFRSGEHWSFVGGWQRTFEIDGASNFRTFETVATDLAEDPELFGANQERLIFGRALADQLTVQELSSHLDRMSRAGFDVSALQVGLYQKFVTPFVAVFLVLVGVPLVISGWSRRGSLYGFGLSLLITLAFWAIWAVSTSLGREGVISPHLAAFAPPALLVAAGLFLLGRSR